MRHALLLLLLAACATRAPSLTVEQALAGPQGPAPFRFAFNHDATRIAYLKGRADSRLTDLWVYDIRADRHEVWLRAEGPEELTSEQRAARERRRDHTLGISRFWWNPRDDSLLLTLSGDLYVLRDGALERLTQTEAAETDPAWSPDGTAVAYVRDRNLWLRRGGREWQLTDAGGGTVTCGAAEFIAMEELGRHEGFWWSPDGGRIAYVEVDEAAVPAFHLHDYLDVRGRPVEQLYPRAGDPNVSWSLKVVPAAGGPPVSMQVAGEYLVRAAWMPDGRLAVQVSDRPQRTLSLFACDPESGAATPLLEEHDDAWVAFHSDLRFLDDGSFLWTSERSGRRRLYRWEKGELRALTGGGGDVAAVATLTPAGAVLFSGSLEDPRERHLYRVAPGGDPVRLTTPGWHDVSVSADGRYAIDVRSRAGEPPAIDLLALDAAAPRVVAALHRPRPLPALPRPEFVTVPADDGTPLQAMLLRGPRGGPALIHCYGGPGSHLVADRWGGATGLWHARLVERGYTVLVVDGRGTDGYGRDFCRVVSGRLCDWEVRDQAAAARWLRAQGAPRVGIWGWSYGGTLTLMCLLHAPDAFDAGVAVAPVTDWRDYDTAYTERYLGLPAENAAGYDLSSPITAAASLRRPLLLAHGFMDDNVHFRGAAAFVDRAQQAGVGIEVDFYPRGAHGIGGPVERRLLFSRMERFLDEHLRP